MDKKRKLGIWFIIIFFTPLGLYSLYIGVLSLISPYDIINSLIFSGTALSLSGIFSINFFTGEPLIEILPIIGILFILLAILLIVDVYGLLRFKSWAWIITGVIALFLLIILIGLFMFWILDEEETKLAFNQV